ncbi:hypothetical protein GCM10007916_07970 [Psychromonas marina]|uniref:DUF4381 domain-containing protein n=1 Tax=Psychromonas marina TaxID=88364 RepID=A0ABQ6DXN8_9GAMM|nr:DUF4381 domain-containing protein [Psychromonas marina]GLS89730.1 hypothetical protein GCM10007916_07970 [Psychromonas marina]
MSPLANQDPLAQLNDIIGPSTPSWFPPAPIYWLLLCVTIIVLGVSYYFLKKYHQQQKIKQSHLLKLAQLKQQQIDFISLNQLLKGCALTYFPRSDVASLHGEAWFDFLQKHSDVTLFDSKQAFIKRLYQNANQPASETDFIDAKKWISTLPKQIKKAQKDV